MLYGQDDNDVFIVTGKSGGNSQVRIIGGIGRDSIIDNSKVGGPGKATKVYDTKEGNYLDLGTEAQTKPLMIPFLILTPRKHMNTILMGSILQSASM